MTRIKRGLISHKKHKKILKLTKKFFNRRKNTIKIAKQSFLKANQYSYIDRKKKKRKLRSLWIIKINAIVRQYGFTYSNFIKKINLLKINFNRKILSLIIDNNNKIFNQIMIKIKSIYEFNK